MKIYTYHDDLGRGHELELIELWKTSWSNHGYEAICLNRSHTESHPFFKEFDLQLRKVCYDIIGAPISDYGMSCWHRWLAYATQPSEKFYVSDYDAINYNFSIIHPNDNLHLFDNACPFFASGTAQQFEKLCKGFIDVSLNRMDFLKRKDIPLQTRIGHYHDQEFFQFSFLPINPDYKSLRENYEILMTRDTDRLGCQFFPDEEIQSQQVFHVSMYNTLEFKKRNPEFNNHSEGETKVLLAKKILELYKQNPNR